MRDYVFKILDVNGIEVGSYYNSGENVMDAFEIGIEDGSIYFNGTAKVVAINTRTELAISFEACRAE